MAKTYFDSFNRADSSSLGTASDGLFSWTSFDCGISSNKARTVSPGIGTYTGGVPDALCDTDTLYVYGVLSTFTRVSGVAQMFYSIAYDPNTDSGGYQLILEIDSGGAVLLILWDYQNATSLASTTLGAVPTGSTLRIERTYNSGTGVSSCRVYIDGVLTLSGSSTTSVGSQYRGSAFVLYADVAGDVLELDSFGYGDLPSTIANPLSGRGGSKAQPLVAN